MEQRYGTVRIYNTFLSCLGLQGLYSYFENRFGLRHLACRPLVAIKSKPIHFQLSYALITAVFIYFVVLVITRLIPDKPKKVLEHKQQTETILEAKRNEIREQKRREGKF